MQYISSDTDTRNLSLISVSDWKRRPRGPRVEFVIKNRINLFLPIYRTICIRNALLAAYILHVVVKYLIDGSVPYYYISALKKIFELHEQ